MMCQILEFVAKIRLFMLKLYVFSSNFATYDQTYKNFPNSAKKEKFYKKFLGYGSISKFFTGVSNILSLSINKIRCSMKLLYG